MLAVAVPIGLLIGLSLGTLGGGGSILTVPALVYLLDQEPHAATTASLLIVGITSVAGVLVHARAGRVRGAAGTVFGLVGIGGAYLGSRLSASVDPDVLMVSFAGLMLASAAAMLHHRRRGRGAEDRNGRDDPAPAGAGGSRRPGSGVATLTRVAARPAGGRRDPRRAGVVAVTGLAVGLVTGFFGVGGGFVVVPALVLALGFDMPAAVGTSLLVITINSAAALAARLHGGVHLDAGLLAAFTAAAIVGTLAGGRVASRVRPQALATAFAVLLVVLAGYIAARSLPHLVR